MEIVSGAPTCKQDWQDNLQTCTATGNANWAPMCNQDWQEDLQTCTATWNAKWAPKCNQHWQGSLQTCIAAGAKAKGEVKLATASLQQGTSSSDSHGEWKLDVQHKHGLQLGMLLGAHCHLGLARDPAKGLALHMQIEAPSATRICTMTCKTLIASGAAKSKP